MATVSKWTPFGVALDLTATSGTVTRTSATKFTVNINVSWKTTWNDAKTDYGMDVTSGGVTKTISTEGTKRESGSGSLTGTFSISGNGSATKSITVTFRNYNSWAEDSATKSITLSVNVPAWTSYKVTYNANGGSGAPGSQTKWKDQTLTLSTTKPTRTGYSFQGWATSSTGSVAYASGANYTANSAATLYAVWKANTYKVTYNANGGSGAPSAQTKTYGVTLKLSSTVPTRTNYTFKGWATSSSATVATYAAGANYANNAAVTLYAVWELAYKKPSITKLAVDRCSMNVETGEYTLDEMGTYALVTFNWTTFQSVKSATISWVSANSAAKSKAITLSGLSGTSTIYIGDGELLTDASYDIYVAITDGNGDADHSTMIMRTLPGAKFAIDVLAGAKGVSVGKPAELAGYFDSAYKIKARDDIEVVNNKKIFGTSPDGSVVDALNPQNENGNTVLGYGNYDRASGNTNVYGHDVHIGVSNIKDPGYYRPYRRQGDSTTFNFDTAGYVTNAGADVRFLIPFSVPIVGSPTVSVTGSMVLRQDGKYTHGSASGSYVAPVTIKATAAMWCGVYVIASFTDLTNVINNAPIGIQFNGTVSFQAIET